MDQKFSDFSKFRESDKSMRHELGQFKDIVCCLCLAGAVVASWPLTQEVAGSSLFVTAVKTFRKNSIEA